MQRQQLNQGRAFSIVTHKAVADQLHFPIPR